MAMMMLARERELCTSLKLPKQELADEYRNNTKTKSSLPVLESRTTLTRKELKIAPELLSHT
jgi:hypothetical protein